MFGGWFFVPSVWETKLCTKLAQPGYINALNKKLKWQWTAAAVPTKPYLPVGYALNLECKSEYFEEESLVFSAENKRQMQKIKEKNTWKSEFCTSSINYYLEEGFISRHELFCRMSIVILAIMSLPWPLGEILKEQTRIIILIDAMKVLVVEVMSIKNAIFFFGGYLLGNILGGVDVIRSFVRIEECIGAELELIEREIGEMAVFRELENKKAADTLKAMVGTVNQKTKVVAL